MTPPPPPPALAPVAVTARCAGCGACLLTCPVHAIRPLGGTLLVRAELCTGCLECVEVCPVDAVEETSAAVSVAPAAENSADTAVEPPEERP